MKKLQQLLIIGLVIFSVPLFASSDKQTMHETKAGRENFARKLTEALEKENEKIALEREIAEIKTAVDLCITQKRAERNAAKNANRSCCIIS